MVGCKPISDDEMNCPDMNLPKTKVLTEHVPWSEGRETEEKRRNFLQKVTKLTKSYRPGIGRCKVPAGLIE
jgi:hypothetical protein